MGERNICGRQMPAEIRKMLHLPAGEDVHCGREPVHKGPCKLHVEDGSAVVTIAWKLK